MRCMLESSAMSVIYSELDKTLLHVLCAAVRCHVWRHVEGRTAVGQTPALTVVIYQSRATIVIRHAYVQFK